MIQVVWVPTLPQMEADYRAIARGIQKTRVPLKKSVKDVVIPSIKNNFTSGGRPTWSPLAAYTVEKKGHGTPLREDGGLRRNAGFLKSWTIVDGEAGMDGMEDYAGYQNVGFYNVQFNTDVPARPFALFQEQDVEDIIEVFDEWIEELIEDNNTRG